MTISLDVYDQKHVTTRKPHYCQYCGAEIPAGTENVLCEHGIYADGPFTRYACHKCEPYLDEFWEYMDGECWDFIADWDEFMHECHPELVEDDDED